MQVLRGFVTHPCILTVLCSQQQDVLGAHLHAFIWWSYLCA